MECEYNRKYRVHFRREVVEYAHLDVSADCIDDAVDMAFGILEDGDDPDYIELGDDSGWDIENKSNDVERIDNVRVPSAGGSLLPQHINAATGYKGQEQMLM